MIPLNSSAIAGVEYHSGTLVIYFHASGGYTFYGVPYSVYAGLVSSSSPGTYYNQNIQGHYR